MKKENKKALMIASMGSMLDNFNRRNIEILMKQGYEITIAANFKDEDSNSEEKNAEFVREMKMRGYEVVQIDFSRKISNIAKQIKSVRQVRKLLKKDFDLVHCHSPICSVIVRSLYKKYRKDGKHKLLYTAHGFHFYDGAPQKNWKIFYPIEKKCSKWTDVLITINQEDYKRAKGSFYAKKVVYLPGIGVNIRKFSENKVDKGKIKESLGLKSTDTMILSVGELSKRKNQETVIRALKDLKNKDIKYVIVGKGSLEKEYKDLIEKLNLKDHVILLGYRNDISELCKASDIYIFPSLQEGLPVAMMEAMASGCAIIASNVRGNKDLLDSPDGGLLVEPGDVTGFKRAIETIIKMDRTKMGLYNLKKIKNYDERIVDAMMKGIYCEMLN